MALSLKVVVIHEGVVASQGCGIYIRRVVAISLKVVVLHKESVALSLKAVVLHKGRCGAQSQGCGTT